MSGQPGQGLRAAWGQGSGGEALLGPHWRDVSLLGRGHSLAQLLSCLCLSPTGTKRGPREARETRRGRAAWTAWRGCDVCPPPSLPFPLLSPLLIRALTPSRLEGLHLSAQESGLIASLQLEASSNRRAWPKRISGGPQRESLASIPDLSVSGPVHERQRQHTGGRKSRQLSLLWEQRPIIQSPPSPWRLHQGPQELKAGPQDGGFVSTGGIPRGTLLLPEASTSAGALATGFPPAAPTPPPPRPHPTHPPSPPPPRPNTAHQVDGGCG